MEIHQKKAGPDYHRLKTVVNTSIEQDLRNRNFAARNGNYEKNAVVKNQGTKQRGQRILGDCWQLEANGQCSKGDNCSFRHDVNKRAKMTQPNPSPNSFMQQSERKHREPEVPEERVPVVECLDGHARITSQELAPIHSVKSGTLQNAFFYKTKSGCRFGEKCSFAHRQVDEQPSTRSKKNDDKSAVAMLKYELHDRTEQPVVDRDTRHESNHGPVGCSSSNTLQLGCVFQDMEPQKLTSILRKSTDMQIPIQRVKFTKAIARHTKIRDQNPSLGVMPR